MKKVMFGKPFPPKEYLVNQCGPPLFDVDPPSRLVQQLHGLAPLQVLGEGETKKKGPSHYGC